MVTHEKFSFGALFYGKETGRASPLHEDDDTQQLHRAAAREAGGQDQRDGALRARGHNRATFYAHYADPSDLLRSIEDEILNDLSRWLGPAIAAPDGADLAGMLTPIIEYIGENADVCSVLLSSSGDAGFQAKVVDAVEQPFLASFRHGGSREVAEYFYTFAADGCVGMLKKWLAGGMTVPPAKLANMMARFTARAV